MESFWREDLKFIAVLLPIFQNNNTRLNWKQKIIVLFCACTCRFPHQSRPMWCQVKHVHTWITRLFWPCFQGENSCTTSNVFNPRETFPPWGNCSFEVCRDCHCSCHCRWLITKDEYGSWKKICGTVRTGGKASPRWALCMFLACTQWLVNQGPSSQDSRFPVDCWVFVWDLLEGSASRRKKAERSNSQWKVAIFAKWRTACYMCVVIWKLLCYATILTIHHDSYQHRKLCFLFSCSGPRFQKVPEVFKGQTLILLP